MKRLIFGICGSVLLTSCASICGGVVKNVRVSSEPPGALVRLDGVTRGLTPAVLHPSTRNNHVVRVEMPGFEPAEIPLRRGISAWEWGNVVNGFFPGILYDGLTGAVYRFHPGEVKVQLQPISGKTGKTGGTPGTLPGQPVAGRG